MLICKYLAIRCTVCHHVAPQGATQKAGMGRYEAKKTDTERNGKENRQGGESDRNMQN